MKETILILIIVVFLLVTIREYRKVTRFKKHCKQADGKIIDYKEEEGQDGTYFHPIVEFKTGTNKIFKGKAPNALGHKKHNLNDTVRLVFDVKNPADFIIKSNLWLKNITWILPFVISLILTIVTVNIFGK